MTAHGDDLLSQAMRALHETQLGTVDDPGVTKDRILALARARRRRRLTLLRLVLPIAALLVGSLAWAAATGRLPRIFGATGSADPAPVATATATPAPSARLEEPPVPPTPAATASASESATTPVPYERLPDAEQLAGRGAPPAASVSASSEPSSRESMLYEAAHRLHFVDRDANRALVAWDQYLSEFPRGRLAPEARYNRALTLVRLGRRNEAREALSPFASGAYGAYRQHEAQQLLEQLR